MINARRSHSELRAGLELVAPDAQHLNVPIRVGPSRLKGPHVIDFHHICGEVVQAPVTPPRPALIHPTAEPLPFEPSGEHPDLTGAPQTFSLHHAPALILREHGRRSVLGFYESITRVTLYFEATPNRGAGAEDRAGGRCGGKGVGLR